MILACGYFTVNTVFLKRLYVLFFFGAGQPAHRLHRLQRAPGRWLGRPAGAQPGLGAAGGGDQARFLIHDRDSNFPAAFEAIFGAEGLEVIRTPVRAPNAKAYASHWSSFGRPDWKKRRRVRSGVPWHFCEGSSPGGSYRQAPLSLWTWARSKPVWLHCFTVRTLTPSRPAISSCVKRPRR